ncbi:protein yippee-like At5g53940 isoform X2 [Vigna unguiculata]|uniref:protein yippee-like At5g53940 isoform X2 n=1 Tax=Vigna unguiculata TaxID=3917 RepID=UPI001016E926|nr:protein yippee-like At5g53940 isoform X2 [Vigna unguiculata]
MGRIFTVELEGKSYGCKSCKTHLALTDDLISRAFYCQRGKAYLFNNVHVMRKAYTTKNTRRNMKDQFGNRIDVNFTIGVLEERMMLSGLHTVADIFCCCCGQIVGWKYESAHERSQKYKEGKFVLERGRIVDEIDFTAEFHIESCVSMSDAEDA